MVHAGIAHMMGSLKAELGQTDSLVSVHTISPGMVLTGAHPCNLVCSKSF